MQKDLKTAITLFREYKLDESRELLEEILKQDASNLEALIMLAKIHFKTQNYGEAINCYNNVLKFDETNIEAKTGLQLIKNILQLTNNFYFENPYTDDSLYEFE